MRGVLTGSKRESRRRWEIKSRLFEGIFSVPAAGRRREAAAVSGVHGGGGAKPILAKIRV